VIIEDYSPNVADTNLLITSVISNSNDDFLFGLEVGEGGIPPAEIVLELYQNTAERTESTGKQKNRQKPTYDFCFN
jgi:hypothetical protein